MSERQRTHSGELTEAVEVIAASADYRELIERLERRVRESQAHAARTLNTELVTLYWSIGHDILEQQQKAGWGDDVVGQIAADLRTATGSARGFSRRNVFYMRRFAAVWTEAEKVPSVMALIPWTAHRMLLDRFSEEPDLYEWYAAKAAVGKWSVRQLQAQIHLKLHDRQGAAPNNFKAALPVAEAKRALRATKDPYIFDFLDLARDARERELEQALIDDVQRFLLELGSGFAFYGRQVPLIVGGEEFFADLLFYHHTLRRFVVIELKVGAFKPEYAGKMNFYLNVVDKQLRAGDDRESVGIILCTEHNNSAAEVALYRVLSPIAVATWQTTLGAKQLPGAQPDPHELAELEEVRGRLVERVSRRAAEIGRDGRSG
jgi:predicted nuclease of restriction endonuclease-like (RecB) superfamily